MKTTMPIKIIATDLDGTLMSPDHLTITPKTIDTLKKAHAKGVKLAIATGRPMAIIGNVIEQIPFCDYVISANGAVIFDRNKNSIIYSNLIDNKRAKKAVEFLLERDVFFEIYINGVSHYQLGTDSFFNTNLPKEFLDNVTSHMIGHSRLVDYMGSSDIEKITIYSIADKYKDEIRQMLLSLDFSVSSSLKNNMESTVKTADKGVALRELCSILKIDREEAMSFGDADNDCEMLEFAGCSFAMDNATQKCKQAARHITQSNALDGLANAVEKYVLL